MATEATCPTCGGPIETQETVEEFDVHCQHYDGSVGTGSGWRKVTRYHSTAADPAQMAAMRELLGEIGQYLENGDLMTPAWSDKAWGMKDRIAKVLRRASDATE